jgi:NADPH:quinone reductase-like Zn-dependent oxidoreductase
MKAVVVTSKGAAPVVTDFPAPVAGVGEEVVEILATGVHQLVRAMAAGTHYGSPNEFPFVPGVDAVARLADGRRAYVGVARAPYGTFSEQTVIPAGWSIPIPTDSTVSNAVLAGSMNPLAAVWMALIHRAELRPGERVLVLGATGASGRLAVGFAKEFGAGAVVAVGRNHAVLDQLADAHAVSTVVLSGDSEQQARSIGEAVGDGVDVVIDYLWGSVAEAAIAALTRTGFGHQAKSVRYVNVGEMAGATATLPAAVLRSSGLTILGSGSGSVDPAAIAGVMPDLIARVGSGSIGVEVLEVPLAEAAAAWSSDTEGRRLVVVP